MAKRVAIYLRVSKSDGSQSVDCQRPDVEQLARARGEIVETYTEEASAVKRRPEYERMLSDAKKGRFDTLAIWAIDRFGRSMVQNLNDLVELDRVGVSVISTRESWMDTSGPMRNILVAFSSWVAENERNRLIERTKAGMARARKFGTKSGRPIGRAKRRVDLDEARKLIAEGSTQKATAKALNVSLATLQRSVAKAA